MYKYNKNKRLGITRLFFVFFSIMLVVSVFLSVRVLAEQFDLSLDEVM